MAKRVLTIGLLLLATVAAGILTGCGGSSESSAEASLTKNQYVEKAEGICLHASQEQFHLAGEYASTHPGVEEEELIQPALIPPLEKELRQLKSLPAPSGEEAEVEAFTAAFETALEAGKKDPPSFLERSHNPFEKANALAASYGMKGCEAP
jgi:hypothetical protein